MNTQTSTTQGPILQAYDHLIADNKITADPMQVDVIRKLQNLHDNLANYQPNINKNSLSILFEKIFKKNSNNLQGIYIYGDVGRGKSMLMDLFFQEYQEEYKQRIHFHNFMINIHNELHDLRNNHIIKKDPIKILAHRILQESFVICLDEMYIKDIADAMIVGRLFQYLFDHGAIFVITSNRHPDELYKDGLKREYFLPFIDLIKERNQVIELQSGHDYRLEKMLALKKTYFHPLGKEADSFLANYFSNISCDLSAGPIELSVNSRKIPFEKAEGDILFSSFEELCCRNLGSSDYDEIANNFHIVIIKDIPKLSGCQHNEAKRFTILIDQLYQHKTKLVCSAETPPQELYQEGKDVFEFERTSSRLMEMQSESYWNLRFV
ncbi:MAG: cell division protein ZapE [Pseudomonadota bacterium]